MSETFFKLLNGICFCLYNTASCVTCDGTLPHIAYVYLVDKGDICKRTTLHQKALQKPAAGCFSASSYINLLDLMSVNIGETKTKKSGQKYYLQGFR